jgi:hypothetical protein
MTVIIGVVFIVVAVTAFIFSLPRGGKVARFVNTNWEGYAVVIMISLLALGAVLLVSGIAELTN